MASVSEMHPAHGQERLPHCLCLSVRRPCIALIRKYGGANKHTRHDLYQCNPTQKPARRSMHYRPHCRCTTMSIAPDEISAQYGDWGGAILTLTHRIPNVCSLTLHGILRNGEGEAVAGLIALHYFYSTRAKRMAAAVLQLLDDNPRLHEVLSDMGKENGSLMPISELTAMLKVNADNAMSYLDSVEMLLTVCKFADLEVANRVEKEISDEVASLALGNSTWAGIGEGDGQAVNETGQLSKLVSSLKWEHWKLQLRSAIINSKGDDGEVSKRTADDFLNIKLHCDSRTASDDAFLENVLEISARGENVVEIARSGLSASSLGGSAAVKSLLFLWFADKPETSMLPSIRALCWQHARMDIATNSSFHCSLHSLASDQHYEEREENEFRFSGNVNDLRALILTVTALESGELEVGKGWTPIDGTIKLRRVPFTGFKGGRTPERERLVYELQVVSASDQGVNVIKLSRRQVDSLIDCLDSLIDLNPSLGLDAFPPAPANT